MRYAAYHLVAAPLLGFGLIAAVPAHAEEEAQASSITISGSATLVSDYRFRGVSQTGGDAAVQGSINLNHSSGLYVTLWASNVSFDKFGPQIDAQVGNAEVDLYAGWSGEVASGLTVDAGLLYYFYPDGSSDTLEVFMPYASVATTLGPARIKVGGTYAWKQSVFNDMDDLQVYTNVDVGIPSTPLTVSAHLGYTDGALSAPWQAGTTDRTGFDYSLGLSATKHGLTLGVSYVGTDGPSIKGITDDAVVGTLSYSF